MRERHQDERVEIADRLRAAKDHLEVELKAAYEKDKRDAIELVLQSVRKMVDNFTKPVLH